MTSKYDGIRDLCASVPCRKCKAKAGESCKSLVNGWPVEYVHAARSKAYGIDRPSDSSNGGK